jgi:hypothetical protein
MSRSAEFSVAHKLSIEMRPWYSKSIKSSELVRGIFGLQVKLQVLVEQILLLPKVLSPAFLRLDQGFQPDCVGRDLPKDYLHERYSEVIQWAGDGKSGCVMKPSFVAVKK